MNKCCSFEWTRVKRHLGILVNQYSQCRRTNCKEPERKKTAFKFNYLKC